MPAFQCPHCGEPIDTWPDPGGGASQRYIEDCPVCCRPNQIQADYDEDEGDWLIGARGEE